MNSDEGFINRVTEQEIEGAKEKFSGQKLCLIIAELDNDQTIEVLFKEPDSNLVKRYVTQANNPKADGTAHHNAFVMDCLITPTREEYFELLKELPALSLTLSPKLIEGHGLANSSKKKSIQ